MLNPPRLLLLVSSAAVVSSIFFIAAVGGEGNCTAAESNTNNFVTLEGTYPHLTSVSIGFNCYDISEARNGTLNPFNITRYTWTIEPAPPGQNFTSVATSPPYLVEPILDMSNESIIDFRPTTFEVQENAGILIQVPADKLRHVAVSTFDVGPSSVQVKKGFTNLASTFVLAGGYSDAVKQLLPGQLLDLRIDATSSNGSFDFHAEGSGLSLQVDANSYEEFSVRASNSTIRARGDVLASFRPYADDTQQRTWFSISTDVTSSKYYCLEKNPCVTTLLYEGTMLNETQQIHANVERGNALNLLVNDPANMFDCASGVEKQGNGSYSCALTQDNVTVRPFDSCTSDPDDARFDVSYCLANQVGDGACFCGAYPTQNEAAATVSSAAIAAAGRFFSLPRTIVIAVTAVVVALVTPYV